jgi:hypothetical protein
MANSPYRPYCLKRARSLGLQNIFIIFGKLQLAREIEVGKRGGRMVFSTIAKAGICGKVRR